MKYLLKSENSNVEFTDIQSAQNYAIILGIPLEQIIEIPNDIQAIDDSSLEVFEQKISAGYPVPNSPYHLALNDGDRAQFSSMTILIRELLDKGYISNSTIQSIKDKDDNIITMTTEQYRDLMIGYGMYYKSIWDSCAPKS